MDATEMIRTRIQERAKYLKDKIQEYNRQMDETDFDELLTLIEKIDGLGQERSFLMSILVMLEGKKCEECPSIASEKIRDRYLCVHCAEHAAEYAMDD